MERLLQLVKTVDFTPHRPARLYFRTMENLFCEAQAYGRDGDHGKAFVIFSRIAIIGLEKLPQHPEYMLPTNAKARVRCRELAALSLSKAEEHKKLCVAQLQAKEAARTKQETEEAQRRDLERQAREQEALEAERRTLMARFERLRLAPEGHDDSCCSSGVPAEKQLSSDGEDKSMAIAAADEDEEPPPEYHAVIGSSDFPAPGRLAATVPAFLAAPVQASAAAPIGLPARPPPSPPQSRAAAPAAAVSSPAAAANASHLDDVALSDTAPSLSGLRPVRVGIDLVPKFLREASVNSARNLETCGILAGRLERGVFTVTTVILPKQKATSDSCDTLDEMELFEYVDGHGLVVLGWIHTHPTQTSFMSSVDLHTQCSYQLMLPEALSIVCSIKYQETKVFTLTTPYGLRFVSDCREPGFHLHPDNPPLYTMTSHSRFLQEVDTTLVDFRTV